MRLAIFFPSKSAQNIPKKTFMDAKEWLEGELSRFFGGLTEYPTSGLWINGEGSLEKEEVTVLETYTPKPFPANEVFKRLMFLREVLGQESLAFAIDSEIYFITKCVEEDGTETSELRIADCSHPTSWMKFRDFWKRKFSNREKKVK